MHQILTYNTKHTNRRLYSILDYNKNQHVYIKTIKVKKSRYLFNYIYFNTNRLYLDNPLSLATMGDGGWCEEDKCDFC